MTTQDLMTIIAVNITLLGVFTTMMYWMMNRIDSDVKNLSFEVKTIVSRLDGHAMRIDQLYRMFIDLLKEGKK